MGQVFEIRAARRLLFSVDHEKTHDKESPKQELPDELDLRQVQDVVGGGMICSLTGYFCPRKRSK